MALAMCGAAWADKIKNPIAVFNGLDKITGRIITFEVNIDETVQFGSLQVTPRVCYSRPPTEAPHTTGFVEVEEAEKNDQFKKIFTGWMFAASPGLSAAEHPVYDIWLSDCKGGKDIIRDARAVEETPADSSPAVTGQPTAPGATERSQRSARTPRNQDPVEVAPPPGGLADPDPAARRPARPRPPVPVPLQRAEQPAPRRAPSQSFFPTFSGGGRAAPPVNRDMGF